MIRRAIALLGALLVTPATAEDRVPDNSMVSATIGALRTGNAAELDWLVTDSSELQFSRTNALDRAEATRTLRGCMPRELSRVDLGLFSYYEFEWKCRKQSYVGKLIPVQHGKAVSLADLVTRAQYDKLIVAIPRVLLPPMPVSFASTPRPPSAAEIAELDRLRAIEMVGKKERAELFARAVASGDMADFQTRHATSRKITYGFYDPYSEVDYVDRTWRIGDSREEAGKALSLAVAHARLQLGPPTSWVCQDAYPYVECTWRYADPGTLLKAKIHIVRHKTPDWGIIVFEFRYETATKMAEAKRRAAG